MGRAEDRKRAKAMKNSKLQEQVQSYRDFKRQVSNDVKDEALTNCRKCWNRTYGEAKGGVRK